MKFGLHKTAKKVTIFSLRKNNLIFLVAILSASCSEVKDSAPVNYSKQWDEIPDAIPKAVKRSRYGNPDSYEVFGKTYYVKDSADGFQQKGIASWYGNKFHGQRTSSGEEYDMYAMTAAHKTLPIPVYVEVKNTDNGRVAIVKVNDRGPFHEGRIIDLSYAAATKLGVAQSGTANVVIRVVTSAEDKNQQRSNAVVESPLDENGKLYVQVAAFGAETNALQYLGKLQGEGFSDVRLHTESKKGKTIYRVRIGPLPTNHVAKTVLSQLKKNNHKNLKILRY
ncbi:Septum-associated rare lipoprotein A [hydrothermal vent metagenome]|uniref:Septum-associated rare lipoprotein A n=1 Tax=hydrothermal vent metagenome TaxID=652676 RepID=A0A3B0WK48_9ZZZZ